MCLSRVAVFKVLPVVKSTDISDVTSNASIAARISVVVSISIVVLSISIVGVSISSVVVSISAVVVSISSVFVSISSGED